MTNHPHRSRQSNLPAVPFHLPRWLKDRERGKQPSKEQIKQLRRISGRTQAEMSAALHVSQRAYEDWEQGRNPMHSAHWLAMRCACHAMAELHTREVHEIRAEREAGELQPAPE